MTEMLHIFMMQTPRNFGYLPLVDFKRITPVKEDTSSKILTSSCFVWDG